MEPRILMALIEGKREIDLSVWKLQGILNSGGSLIEEDKEEILGVDKPVDPKSLSFLRGL